MKIILLNASPDPQPFSKEPDRPTPAPSQHWVVTDTETARKVKYIFRPNGQVLIAHLAAGKAATGA